MRNDDQAINNMRMSLRQNAPARNGQDLGIARLQARSRSATAKIWLQQTARRPKTPPAFVQNRQNRRAGCMTKSRPAPERRTVYWVLRIAVI
jgi:hypothetical protein